VKGGKLVNIGISKYDLKRPLTVFMNHDAAWQHNIAYMNGYVVSSEAGI
jgi:hypothetical protein